ncbi:DUF1045 domain-containing protein [Rhizobium sp. YIM 134829]|uniref:DUF1045 domain-containing protein n=1 Tax=Rhizobium sp. YIM 134829 TaxID=3390453 RepID=UPI00397D0CB6
MRYAICFTPPIHDPLSIAAAEWLGRNVYSDVLCEQPAVAGLSHQDLAFHTAVPRRYGFHAAIKAPFALADGMSEGQLLNQLMRFTSDLSPFEMADVEIAWLGDFFGLAAARPCAEMAHLAASVVQAFDAFRAPLREEELERLDLDKLTAPQFSNLHRWGDPHVMDEFRFHMALSGPVPVAIRQRIEEGLRLQIGPHLGKPLDIRSLALFVEPERGAPLRVHSQHPLGKLAAHRPMKRTDGGVLPPSGSVEADVAAALHRIPASA